ncbi:MAG: ABC transporter permease [Candidatus Kaiserbacteria bacterium]|nr:MAG: ABC transporter permease [Candidatus Kaiserbacteria bacterium]
MSMWTNAKRVARYGLIGFVRNGFVSLAAVLIMTITLFVMAGLLISGAALNSTLKELTSKVDVTVYFLPAAQEETIQQMKRSLEALPEVASVAYVSREQALADFRERHKNDQLTLQALDELGDNPLGASLDIRAKQTSQYESIAQYLETEQQAGGTAASIDKINFFQNKTAIDRLTNIIETSKRLGIAVALVLGLASLLIAFNTIRLAIYTARDEIGVMNLVGAGRWYIRGPFMIAGVLYGVVSGLIVLLLLYPATLWMGPGSERFFGTFNVYTYFLQSFPLIFFTILGAGIALGALSSYLAVRRYLRT